MAAAAAAAAVCIISFRPITLAKYITYMALGSKARAHGESVCEREGERGSLLTTFLRKRRIAYCPQMSILQSLKIEQGR